MRTRVQRHYDTFVCMCCVSRSYHWFTQPAAQPLTLALYGFLTASETFVKEPLCTTYLNPLNAPVWIGISSRSRSCSSGSPGAEELLREALPPAWSRILRYLSRTAVQVREHRKTRKPDRGDWRVNHWLGICAEYRGFLGPAILGPGVVWACWHSGHFIEPVKFLHFSLFTFSSQTETPAFLEMSISSNHKHRKKIIH